MKKEKQDVKTKTLRKVFSQHGRNARRRVDVHGNPIQFKLSFDEWLSIWEKSGHLNERGAKKGQYVMSRIGDTGNYEVGNVFIQLFEDNISQGNKGKNKPKSLIHVEKHKAKVTGVKKPWVSCQHCGKRGGVRQNRKHESECNGDKNK